MVDWASFLVVQTVVASPIASGPARRIAGAVNVSYKRDGASSIDDFDGLGALDFCISVRSRDPAARSYH